MATLDNVSVNIAVVLGTTSMPIHQVLRLGRGAVIELDASEEDEVRILAGLLARLDLRPVDRATAELATAGGRDVDALDTALALLRVAHDDPTSLTRAFRLTCPTDVT